MSSLTVKQKIILGIIIGLMLIVIGIYGYISLNQDEELDISEIANSEMDSNISQDENDTEENEESNSEDSDENFRTS